MHCIHKESSQIAPSHPNTCIVHKFAIEPPHFSMAAVFMMLCVKSNACIYAWVGESFTGTDLQSFLNSFFKVLLEKSASHQITTAKPLKVSFNETYFIYYLALCVLSFVFQHVHKTLEIWIIKFVNILFAFIAPTLADSFANSSVVSNCRLLARSPLAIALQTVV